MLIVETQEKMLINFKISLRDVENKSQWNKFKNIDFVSLTVIV